MKKKLLFLSLFLLIIPIYGNAIVSPTNEFYINDYANILSSETEEYITEVQIVKTKIKSSKTLEYNIDIFILLRPLLINMFSIPN